MASPRSDPQSDKKSDRKSKPKSNSDSSRKGRRRADDSGEAERSAASAERDATRFRALADKSLDRILELDATGKIVYASPNHGNTQGFRSASMIGQRVESFIHLEDLPALEALLHGALEDGKSMRAAYRAHAPGGEWRWVEVSLTPFDREDGELGGLLIARDVTEKKQLEVKLAESERRLRLTMDNAYDVISVYSEDGGLLYSNPSSRSTFGWEVEARAAQDPASVLHPDDRKLVFEGMARAHQGEPVFLKYRIQRADGGWLWIESTTNGYVTETGDRRIVTIARDVTDREHAAVRLGESESRYRRLVENSPEAIVVLEGPEIRFANSAAAKLFGVAGPSLLIGRAVLDSIQLGDGPLGEFEAPSDVDEEGHDFGELTLVRDDGAARDVVASGIRTSHEGRDAYQVVLRDVTALRDADRERTRMHDALMESRRLESLVFWRAGSRTTSTICFR